MIALEQVGAARAEAASLRRRLVEVLEERLGLDPDRYVQHLAESHGVPALSMGELHKAAPAFDVLPLTEAASRGCVLVRGASNELLLVTDDPFSVDNQAWAEERIEPAFEWRIAHRRDLAAFLSSHEETLRALDAVKGDITAVDKAHGGVEDLSLRAISEEGSEVIRLVRSTLRDALLIGASDVHMETGPAGLAIKFRIDGILSQAKSIHDPAQAEQAIARVKVLAELDITERRIPQDGRFKAMHRSQPIDFRVSIMPSIHGEDAVLRILDKRPLYEEAQKALTLEALGFEPGEMRALRRLAREPYGMLLVTGPTGSGKTTTLYAAITEINTGQDKIVTIEDPVEYQLPGVLQIPVNEKKGLTFAKGLRSILRHDPDKIMVGEIRDPETASIAVQSALTGHLVFTTVHANSVFDVIGRFMHMNVDLHSFVSALNGIIAQRLVRLVCAHCAAKTPPPAQLIAESGLDKTDLSAWRFRAGKGCRDCRGLGYRGRKAIAEMLILSDELRELIAARAPARQIKDAALRHGTRFLRTAALEAVRCGDTTLEEINRVTFVA